MRYLSLCVCLSVCLSLLKEMIARADLRRKPGAKVELDALSRRGLAVALRLVLPCAAIETLSSPPARLRSGIKVVMGTEQSGTAKDSQSKARGSQRRW